MIWEYIGYVIGFILWILFTVMGPVSLFLVYHGYSPWLLLLTIPDIIKYFKILGYTSIFIFIIWIISKFFI